MYGIIPYISGVILMSATARLELRFEPDEKSLVERAAAVRGVSVSAFVRSTTLDVAKQVVVKNEMVVMSPRDSARVLKALDRPFKPNRKLTKLLKAVKQIDL
jgi:uncharacterized protein (DUF1778 family)